MYTVLYCLKTKARGTIKARVYRLFQEATKSLHYFSKLENKIKTLTETGKKDLSNAHFIVDVVK